MKRVDEVSKVTTWMNVNEIDSLVLHAGNLTLLFSLVRSTDKK